MKALVKTATGAESVELRDLDSPGPPPPDHVVLRVLGTGICGTDLHILRDEFPSTPPVTMGHEIGGVVHALGEGVPEGWLGARAAIETYFFTCGECLWCRSGRVNLCPRRRSLGSHTDGGFAEYVSVPAANLHRVPDDLPDSALALMEPLACVCHNLLDPPAIEPGDRVLVTGPGAVGILAAQVAAASGAEVLITGLDRDARRLAVAASLGLRTTTTSRDTQLSDLSADDAGFDAVVECSGAGPAIAAGLVAVRRGGTFVQIGLAGGAVTVPFDEVCYREVRVRSGFGSTPASWERASRLVHQHRVTLAPLVTRVAPLTQWRETFAATGRAEGVKFVLDPTG